MPLLAWMKQEGLDWLAGVEQMKIAMGDAKPIKGGFEVETNQATLSMGAAHNNVAKFAYYQAGPDPDDLTKSATVCEPRKSEAALTVGDVEKVWPDAA
jgi:hypothetical protein